MKFSTLTVALLSILLVSCGGEDAATAGGSTSSSEPEYLDMRPRKVSGRELSLRNTDFSKRTSTCGLYAQKTNEKSSLSRAELEAEWVGLTTQLNNYTVEVNKRLGGSHESHSMNSINRLSMEIDVLDCKIDKL